METDPASVVTISASGVVAIALASTGFILLSTMFSQVFPPRRHDLIEMLKDDLAHLAPQPRRTVVLKPLFDIEGFRMQPILALGFSLLRMHVHWLIALIRIEVKPPALHIENGGHPFAVSIIKRRSWRMLTSPVEL
jgi:hypothetical protein